MMSMELLANLVDLDELLERLSMQQLLNASPLKLVIILKQSIERLFLLFLLKTVKTIMNLILKPSIHLLEQLKKVHSGLGSLLLF